MMPVTCHILRHGRLVPHNVGGIVRENLRGGGYQFSIMGLQTVDQRSGCRSVITVQHEFIVEARGVQPALHDTEVVPVLGEGLHLLDELRDGCLVRCRCIDESDGFLAEIARVGNPLIKELRLRLVELQGCRRTCQRQHHRETVQRTLRRHHPASQKQHGVAAAEKGRIAFMTNAGGASAIWAAETGKFTSISRCGG